MDSNGRFVFEIWLVDNLRCLREFKRGVKPPLNEKEPLLFPERGLG
jgi:hypothetical protein